MMTKRQAIRALLAMLPAAMLGQFRRDGQAKDCAPSANGSVVSYAGCPPGKISNTVVLDLTDPEYERDSPLIIGGGGIDSIEVRYNGQTRTLTAAEIWEALG